MTQPEIQLKRVHEKISVTVETASDFTKGE